MAALPMILWLVYRDQPEGTYHARKWLVDPSANIPTQETLTATTLEEIREAVNAEGATRVLDPNHPGNEPAILEVWA